MRGTVQQPGAVAYPANANDDFRPLPPSDVGGGQPQQSGKSTTLLDIIMGNSQ